MKNQFFLVVFILLFIIFTGLIFKNKKAKEYKFRTIIYILIYAVLIGAAGFLGNKSWFSFPDSTIYYILLGWTFILGLLHSFFQYKLLPWTSKKNFWYELSLVLATGLLGAIAMLLAFHYSDYNVFSRLGFTSILLFFVPFLFYSSYLRYINIPVKVLRKWHYPVDKHIEDPNDREMESPLVIGFEFKKKPGDENMTSFRAKAPKEMVFGKLFYYFINDYNDRNPDEKIEYLDNNKPVGWIFYFKPKWFSSIRYIDPEETNSFNFIKENSVIVCKRVIEI